MLCAPNLRGWGCLRSSLNRGADARGSSSKFPIIFGRQKRKPTHTKKHNDARLSNGRGNLVLLGGARATLRGAARGAEGPARARAAAKRSGEERRGVRGGRRGGEFYMRLLQEGTFNVSNCCLVLFIPMPHLTCVHTRRPPSSQAAEAFAAARQDDVPELVGTRFGPSTSPQCSAPTSHSNAKMPHQNQPTVH
jgi:hypothetical protein